MTCSTPQQPHPPRSVRRPAVAGTFYPADPARCTTEAAALLREAAVTDRAEGPSSGGVVRPWKGAVVPHAGWICSGAIAARSVAAIAASGAPDVVVVFGAVHTPVPIASAVLCSAEVWAEPTGPMAVCCDVAARLAGKAQLFVTDDRFHRHEHAVEVELPLVQAAWPNATLLPVEVPLIDGAAEVGRHTAREVEAAGLSAVFLASSDLTHYGPAYGFTPAGVGPGGLAWAKDNDRRLIELVTALSVDRIVPHVRDHANACGGGAIAAMLGACLESGATSAKVLRHANSFETLESVAPQPPVDAVGYAAVVVG